MSFPTSYIKTEGAQVTREAEHCSRVLLSEVNDHEGTFLVECLPTIGVRGTIFSIGPDRFQIRFEEAGNVRLLYQLTQGDVVTVAISSIGPTAIQEGDKLRVAFAYNKASKDLRIFASTGDSYQNAVWESDVESLHIGVRETNVDEFANWPIRSARYIPRSLTTTELEALTS